MEIALDYDGTVTADPELWRLFVDAAKQRGHSVYLVTMRYSSEPVDQWIERIVDRVFYTGRRAKSDFMAEQGISPSIWIDDMPVFILHGA